MSQEWAEKELAWIDLGDARINKRSITLLERLGRYFFAPFDWYRCRWEVEIFFDVLKNGCQVDALNYALIVDACFGP